uniref:DUF393 domain-containing protein n=1 Tax=Syphacia muris TaxID=451379 RepID=A0A0N5AYI1_9BILA
MTGDRTSQKALIQFIFVLSKNISAMLFVSISFANSDIVKVIDFYVARADCELCVVIYMLINQAWKAANSRILGKWQAKRSKATVFDVAIGIYEKNFPYNLYDICGINFGDADYMLDYSCCLHLLWRIKRNLFHTFSPVIIGYYCWHGA